MKSFYATILDNKDNILHLILIDPGMQCEELLGFVVQSKIKTFLLLCIGT